MPNVVDWSDVNDMPWWMRKGYKNREEAWESANLSAMCILSPAQLDAQQKRGAEINRKAREGR